MSLLIRDARPGDAPLVHAFIMKLAVYEKLGHEVVATPQSIDETLFCELPKAFCLIAEYEGEAAGIALYFYNYSTFLGRHGIYLEDLFVDEAFRGKGIGKGLLAELAARTVDQNCGRLEWSVLDWNTPSIDFYKSLGATPMDGWTIFRLTGASLEALSRTAPQVPNTVKDQGAE